MTGGLYTILTAHQTLTFSIQNDYLEFHVGVYVDIGGGGLRETSMIVHKAGGSGKKSQKVFKLFTYDP